MEWLQMNWIWLLVVVVIALFLVGLCWAAIKLFVFFVAELIEVLTSGYHG